MMGLPARGDAQEGWENMTTKERMKLLQAWKAHHDSCEKYWNRMESVFGNIDCGNIFYDAIWGIFERNTTALSESIGDSCEWLDWYCYDNEMGGKGFEAKASAWKRKRKIKTLKDLCKLIEADIEVKK